MLESWKEATQTDLEELATPNPGPPSQRPSKPFGGEAEDH